MKRYSKHPSDTPGTEVETTTEKVPLSRLYKDYYNPLLHYGLIILPDKKVVEDRIQDLFLWFLEDPLRINNVINIEVYLFQSLKQNLRRHLSNQNRRRKEIPEFHDDIYAEAVLSPEQEWIDEERAMYAKDWVAKRIAQLPVRQRQIVFLRYYQGLSYEDISEITSLKHQVLRNYLSRALKKMREAANVMRILLYLMLSLLPGIGSQ